jgi:hypothetical protein
LLGEFVGKVTIMCGELWTGGTRAALIVNGAEDPTGLTTASW